MSEWQPIETAPKKGLILGYNPKAKPGYQVDCYFADMAEAVHFNLTHWMPVPPPPATPTPEPEHE